MALNINSEGLPLSFQATINTDNMEVSILEINKKLQTAGDQAIANAKKQEQALAGVVDTFSKASTSSDKLWKSQANSVEALGSKFDKSAQDLKDYLAVIDEYNKAGINVPTNQAAPQSFKPPAKLPDTIEGIDPKLLEDSRKVLSAMDDETKEFIRSIQNLRQKLAETSAAQKLLNKQREDDKISLKQYNEASRSLAAQEKVLQDNLKDTIAAQKAYEASNNSMEGSLIQKKALLVDLVNQWEQLSQAERDMPEVGGQLKADYAALRQEIDQLSLDNFNAGAEKAKTAFTELRELKNRIAAADPKDAAVMDELIQRAGELHDKMGDASAAIKLAGSDTAGLDATIQGVRGVVAGFTALQGLIGLISDENEDLAKTTATVTSSMAALNGVQEIASVLDKNSALNIFLQAQYRRLAASATTQQAVATTGLTAATGVQTAATASATTAQVGLNAAMAANPAGVLILAITAIVGAMYLLSDSNEEAKEKQIELNDAMAKAQDILNDLARSYASFYTQYATEAENAVALAQAEGKSEKEILALKQKAAQAKGQEASYILGSLGYVGATTNEIRKQIALKQTELEMAKEKLRSQLLSNAADEDAIKLLESKVNLLNAEVSGANNAYQQLVASDSQSLELEAEKRRKAREDAFKSETAMAEARLIQSTKNTATELAAQKEAIKARTREELSNVNLTAGERAKILAQEKEDLAEADRNYQVLLLNNQKSLIQARLSQIKDGSIQELELKNQLIQKNAEIELAQEGITAAKKKEIQTAVDKQIAENKRQYFFQAAKDARQTDVEDIESRLVKAQEGSLKELSLKRDLLNKKEELDIISAQQQIKNESLLQATILNISAKGQRDRRKLGEDYVNFQLEQNARLIQQQTEQKNIPLQGIVEDPMASARKKMEAQKKINENLRDSLVKQVLEIDKVIASSVMFGTDADLNKLVGKRADIYAQILRLVNQINNSDKQKLSQELKEVGDWITFGAQQASQLAEAFGGVNDNVAKLLGDLSSVANIAGSAVSAVGKFAAGDIAGGVSSVIGIVTSVLTLGKQAKESAEKARAEVEAFNQRMLAGEIEITQQYRERVRQQVTINKLKLEGLAAERRMLEEQKRAVADQQATLLRQLQGETFVAGMGTKKNKGVLGTGLFKKTSSVEINEALAGKTFEEIEQLYIKGQLTGRAKEIFEQLKKIKEEGADINELLEENKQKLQEAVTGTTASGILDSIVDGFANGLRSAEDFAGKFEEFMKGAVLNALKYQVLEGPLKEFYAQFASDAESGGVVTEEEMKLLKERFNAIMTNAGNKFQELQDITNIDFASSGIDTTIKGAYKSMSEETANLLVGSQNGMRLTLMNMLQVSTQSYSELQRIESNTAATVVRMDRMLDKFDSYESGAKKLHVEVV